MKGDRLPLLLIPEVIQSARRTLNIFKKFSEENKNPASGGKLGDMQCQITPAKDKNHCIGFLNLRTSRSLIR